MNKFVEHPNLPKSAAVVLLGEIYSDKLSLSLKKYGFTPVLVPHNPYLSKELSGHADLSVLHGGGEWVFLAPYLKNSNFSACLQHLGAKISYIDMEQCCTYPYDVGMNLCVCGEHVIFNPRTSNPLLVNYLTIEGGLNPILCKQGYSRCSVCIVNDKSIITSDRGIAEIAKKYALSVLEIAQGFISLPGYKYGFIGGSSFKAADDIIVFTGVLHGHPDEKRILEFLSEQSVKPLFLTDEPIFDIGGIIPLSEKKPI